MMDPKVKYLMLVLPTFILSIILLYILPENRSLLAMSPVIGAWIVYFLWQYASKSKDDEEPV
ncbi:hypothetical protein [Jeotgalibacillus aurantiacus]|uniref:hypothetical protein n=1 Tax=Jeotgalibacillus aurantiacus TaxID=2763266 RepID=UPI001D0ABC38|nr:hypothetical protein [Jeotgalibacillus aurantiacus]